MRQNIEATLVPIWAKISKDFRPIELVRNVKSGKEADVYLVQDADHNLFALKVYAEHAAYSTQARYKAGKHMTEKSARRAMAAKNAYGLQISRQLWTMREHYLLRKLYAKGAYVPKVFAMTTEAILMEYFGTETTPAPRLIDIELTPAQAAPAFRDLIKGIKLCWEIGVVHGDLSAYNVLYWQDQVYMIDFPQALDIQRNPNALEKLRKDVENVCAYFRIDPEQIWRDEIADMLPRGQEFAGGQDW
jgi:RIO kinase 1